jgi:hypothetical protein
MKSVRLVTDAIYFIFNIIMADVIDLSESDTPSISAITLSASSSVSSVSQSNDRVIPSIALTPDRDVHSPAPLTKLSHTTIARVLITGGLGFVQS